MVANIMASIAACRALGLRREKVADALADFSNEEHNPGRAGLYKVRGGYVLVDYGHNPDAFHAVCEMMAAQSAGRRGTGIIGVPGDRDDSLIEQAGRVAARGFHRIIIKEDKDLRGRERGEVARLLCRTVNDESPETECMIVLDEVEALRAEIQAMEHGQVVVVFYDKLEPILKVLKDNDARPALAIEAERCRVEMVRA